MKLPLSLSILAGTLVLASTPSSAQSYIEVGDAGQTFATAQGTGANGGGLNAIVGNISGVNDADLYVLMITAPTTFTATTMNVVSAGLDTALFLFSSLGNGIYTNDDATGVSLQSTLPAGTSFTMTLNPGIYVLGISLSGNEPINLNNQLLFAGFPGGDSTAVRGPAAGINPNTHSNFDSLASFPQSGMYQIDMVSVAAASGIPEPSETALCAIGLAVLLLAWKRRHSKARA